MIFLRVEPTEATQDGRFVRAEGIPPDTIRDVITQAIALGQKLECGVVVNINTVDCYTRPTDNPAQAYTQYKALARVVEKIRAQENASQ